MKRFDQINMIPFIDIILVLLAIVLTTASFVSKGLIDIDLPQASTLSSSSNKEFKTIEIAINENNVYYYEKQETTLEELGKKLEALPKNQLFVLRVDKAARFENFIRLIDLLKTGEFPNLSIQAEHKAQS